MAAMRLMSVAFTMVLCTTTALAQDFHVETIVHDLSRPEPKELVRSVTLFHAGKTYDFINQLGELIVFEPSQGRFVLVNTRQARATTVHIDEIRHMILVARQALDDHMKALRTANKPGAQALIEQLAFQFDPQFDESFTQRNGDPLVELNSKHFHYQVLGASPPTPKHGEVYLNYADWICRLNYVLQPSGILPEQRVVLDDALRKAKLVPVEVNFAGGVGDSIRIRAQHRIFWELNERDRELIRQWDSLLAGRELKRMSFAEYQRALLVSQTSRRR